MTVRRGEVYENSVCGERVVIRTGNDETGGQAIVWDLYLKPGGAVVGEHFNSGSNESFTLVDGSLGLRLDGKKQVMDEPGMTATARPGMPHFFWNAGNREARVLVEMRGRADRFEQMVFRQLFGLARDGRTDERGVPNFWQTAVTSREFWDTATFTKPPVPVQKILFTAAAPIARLLGYRGLYHHYENARPDGHAEPEPLPDSIPEPVSRDES